MIQVDVEIAAARAKFLLPVATAAAAVALPATEAIVAVIVADIKKNLNVRNSAAVRRRRRRKHVLLPLLLRRGQKRKEVEARIVAFIKHENNLLLLLRWMAVVVTCQASLVMEISRQLLLPVAVRSSPVADTVIITIAEDYRDGPNPPTKWTITRGSLVPIVAMISRLQCIQQPAAVVLVAAAVRPVSVGVKARRCHLLPWRHQHLRRFEEAD